MTNTQSEYGRRELDFYKRVKIKSGRPTTGTYVYDPSHPRANGNGYVPTYIWNAEKALGKTLPHGVVVHHVDEDRTNHQNSNLVICQSQAYHMLLHRRLRALRACGRADWCICHICHKYDKPSKLVHTRSFSYYHRACHAAYEYERKRRCPAA